MSNRITQTLAHRNGRKLLVPFLTVGYPTNELFGQLARAAIDAGADMLELGIPFSDPLADGPQVQLSSQVALQNGVTSESVFEVAAVLHHESSIPLVAMGYYNPIFSRGAENYLTTAKASGIDGLIVPDLPHEEANGYLASTQAHEISTIFLVAPTSSSRRVAEVEAHCSDFVYAVTVTGVTGAGRQFDNQTDQYLARLRKQLRKPFVAGFGVSSGDSANRLCQYADGVVIGSALIGIIEENNRSSRAVGEVARFLAGVRKALDR